MKVEFVTTLDVRDVDDHRWQLLAPFAVIVDGQPIIVPMGFTTDFASVPRLPITFALFGNIGHRAAVVHDYLYTTGDVRRAKADEIFKALLQAEGVGTFRSNAMYAGVRMAGASHYMGGVK